MLKIYKISIFLLILTASLFGYIIFSAQKIDTKQARTRIAEDQYGEIIAPQSLIIPIEVQENGYLKSINTITREYQSFINEINQKIDTEELDSEKMYTIFGPSDALVIKQINERLKNTLVPGRYKEFHLLLSRSLLKLASYINTSNPSDMLVGLELFEQAQEEYSKLDIG